jgi:ABC-type dipeptide/oligopeptide/nickel transport system permease component
MRDRILTSLLTLWVVSLVSFFAVELAPGDPEEMILGNVSKDVDPETLVRIRSAYHFNQPPWKRYWQWAGSVGRGDLGVSLKTNRPVAAEFRARIPVSAVIAVGAMVLATGIGLGLGTVSVIKEGGAIDNAVRFLSAAFQSVPVFIIGLFMLYIFAFRLKMFPLFGAGRGMGFVLPVAALGTTMGFALARMIRSALLETVHMEPFLAALGKGMTYRRAVVRHGLRNSLTAVVTYLGVRFAVLLGGVVLVETLFALPGMGSYVFEAVSGRDYPVIQAYILFLGASVVTVNFCADGIVRIIDRRGAVSGIR